MIRIGTLQLNKAAPAPRMGIRLGGFRFTQPRPLWMRSSVPTRWPWLRALNVRPSFRGLASLGEVTQETLRGAFDDSIAKARAAFAAATTNAAHYKAIAPYMAITARNLGWVKDGTVKVSDAMRTALEGIEANLRTLRNAAKVRYVNAPNDPPPDSAEALAAVTASINWVAGIIGSGLADSDAAATLVKNLAHKLTPTGILEEAGDVVKTAVNQVAGALHVPTWAIPVGLGAVGLVLLVNLMGGVRALRGAGA